MRKLITLGILLVACAVSMGQTHGVAGLRPGVQPGRFQDLTEDYTTGKRTVTDGIPRVCVMYDDGRANSFEDGDVWQFVSRGIPVGLSLNYNVLTAALRDSIRNMIALGASTGGTVEIVQHGNTNMALVTLYPGAADAGYDDLVDELSPDLLEAAFGQTPRVFVLPGDSKRDSWYSRNQGAMRTLMDSLGLKYGMVTARMSKTDSMTTSEIFPRNVDTDSQTGMTESGTTYLTRRIGARPGMIDDPYWIPRPTWDLGVHVVERGAGNLSGVSAWCVVDPDGDGAIAGGGDMQVSSNYVKTFAHAYSVALAGNLGFAVAMHDSQACDTTDPGITGIAGAELVGQFSPTHVAVVLKALHDAGHIVLVTPTEYCEWLMGEYAPGTDLIANPGCLIPQFDVGDTLGLASEYAWPRGFSMAAHNYSTFNTTLIGTMPQSRYFAGDGFDFSAAPLAKFDRSGIDPDEYQGANVVGYMGRTGGIQMGLEVAEFKLIYGGLPPGRYRWSMMKTGGKDIVLRELHFAAGQKAQLINETWSDEGAYGYADTVLSYRWVDGDETITAAGDATIWHQIYIDFVLPDGRMSGDIWATAAIYGNEAGGNALYAATNRLWRDDVLWCFTLNLNEAEAGAYSTWSHPRLEYLGRR